MIHILLEPSFLLGLGPVYFSRDVERFSPGTLSLHFQRGLLLCLVWSRLSQKIHRKKVFAYLHTVQDGRRSISRKLFKCHGFGFEACIFSSAFRLDHSSRLLKAHEWIPTLLGFPRTRAKKRPRKEELSCDRSRYSLGVR